MADDYHSPESEVGCYEVQFAIDRSPKSSDLDHAIDDTPGHVKYAENQNKAGGAERHFLSAGA